MIISHDLGTTGNKATLVDARGKLVAAVTVTYGADWGADGKAEQKPSDWWHALCQASKSLIESARINPREVEAISFSGQMMGMVPLDGDGNPVRPAIIWADTRAQPQCDQLVERFGLEECYRITGHRLNPTYSLEKIMWLRDNEPENFDRMRHFLMAKDYVAYKLTGVMATDRSDASGTNAYDQHAGVWSADLLAAADVDAALFPEIVESTQVIGTVTADAAKQTGLAEGTKVVMGGGDGPMAALGAGITDPASGAYVYLGSSSWVSVSSPEPLVDPEMRSMTFNHVVPGQFVPTATMQAGGASLAWVVDIFSAEGERQYAELLARASEVEAGTQGLFFLPYLLGERSPYWNPRARGVFAGLHIDHGRPELTRAVIEGVAFNLYTGLRAFTENGIRVDHIDAIGGAANAQLMLSIMADVWQVPISVRDLVDEATAIGAAVTGGVGAGVFDSFDIAKAQSKRTERFDPRPDRVEALRRPYQLFLDAYSRLEPWFDEL